MFNFFKDLTLTQDWLDFFLIYNFISLQNLDRILSPSVQLSGQHDSTEASSANNFDLLEIFYADRLLLAKRRHLLLKDIDIPEPCQHEINKSIKTRLLTGKRRLQHNTVFQWRQTPIKL